MKILSTTTTETSPTRTSLDRRVMVQAEAWYNMTETTTSRKTQVDNKSPTRTTSLTSSSTSLHPGQELQRKTAHKTHMDNKPSTGTTSLTSSSTSLHPGQELQRKTAHKTHMDNKPSTGTTSLTSSSTSLHPGQELQRKTAHKTHMDNKPSTGTISLTSSSALLHPGQELQRKTTTMTPQKMDSKPSRDRTTWTSASSKQEASTESTTFTLIHWSTTEEKHQQAHNWHLQASQQQHYQDDPDLNKQKPTGCKTDSSPHTTTRWTLHTTTNTTWTRPWTQSLVHESTWWVTNDKVWWSMDITATKTDRQDLALRKRQGREEDRNRQHTRRSTTRTKKTHNKQ